MPRKSFYRWLVLTLALALAGAWSFVLVRASVPGDEMPLNAAGTAFEVNPDDQGFFWISDYDAEEIWQVAASGTYTLYPVAAAPSDARRHGSGDVWFADGASNRLGRLSPGNLELTFWTIPGTSGLYGTGIDGAGRIWATDFANPRVYRLTPSSNELCIYVIPDDGMSDYLVTQEQQVWLGDYVNSRILRLDPEESLYTTWDLPADAEPAGMARDGHGSLWWADPNLAELGWLEAESDRLTRFALPQGQLPRMITASGEFIYYTEQSDRGFGILDPSIALSTTVTLTPGTVDVTASCNEVLPSDPSTVTPSAGTASWSGVSYTTLYDSGGWSIYQLPTDSLPWGIAASGSQVWVVDNGRQVLARFRLQIPPLAIEKSASPETYDEVGDVIQYTYEVTNTGTVTLSAIAVSDDLASDESCPAGDLAPGASLTCTASYTITQADLDAGSVTNVAFATGQDPEANPVTSPMDSATVKPGQFYIYIPLVLKSATLQTS